MNRIIKFMIFFLQVKQTFLLNLVMRNRNYFTIKRIVIQKIIYSCLISRLYNTSKLIHEMIFLKPWKFSINFIWKSYLIKINQPILLI